MSGSAHSVTSRVSDKEWPGPGDSTSPGPSYCSVPRFKAGFCLLCALQKHLVPLLRLQIFEFGATSCAQAAARLFDTAQEERTEIACDLRCGSSAVHHGGSPSAGAPRSLCGRAG